MSEETKKAYVVKSSVEVMRQVKKRNKVANDKSMKITAGTLKGSLYRTDNAKLFTVNEKNEQEVKWDVDEYAVKSVNEDEGLLVLVRKSSL